MPTKKQLIKKLEGKKLKIVTLERLHKKDLEQLLQGEKKKKEEEKIMIEFFREHKHEVKTGFKDMDSVFHRTGVALGFQKGRE